MAFLLEVTFRDINLQESKSSMWINTAEDREGVLSALKLVTNAKIARATLSTPVPLVTITDNDAVAENVETATSKVIIQMRGADAASSGEPFAHVRIGIPAPLGSLINGQSGDVTNAEVQSLKSKVLSKTGVQMDVVESIKYSR